MPRIECYRAVVRYGKDHKGETRRRLVSHASARFRREGLNAVGLRALVADAGVTHGAFYAHFPSRAHLVAEAVASAFHGSSIALQGRADLHPGHELAAIVDGYLSEHHVTSCDEGCAAAALAPEIARESPAARAALVGGIDAIAALIAAALPVGGSEPDRLARGRIVFLGMMGVLQLARALDEPGAIRSLLADGRRSAMLLAEQSWA